LIAALSRSGDRKGEEAKHGCCRQNFMHVGSPKRLLLILRKR
jgi:hypothetical protein